MLGWTRPRSARKMPVACRQFKSYVRGYRIARNVYLVSDDMLHAPEFARRTHVAFTNVVKVPLVGFHEADEGDATCLSGAGSQYKSLISAEELGVQLFESATARNAFITAPASFGKLYLIKHVLVPMMKRRYGAWKVWVTSSTHVSGDQVGGCTASLACIEGKERLRTFWPR